MIWGFDCDGVLCDIDPTNLKMIDHMAKEGEDKRHLEEIYYSSRKPLLNPEDFMTPGDKFYVITTRPEYIEPMTKQFLGRYAPNYVGVFHVGGQGSEAFNGNYQEWSHFCHEVKVELIKRLGIEVYIDDNPRLVELYREALPDVKIIQYGGRIRY